MRDVHHEGNLRVESDRAGASPSTRPRDLLTRRRDGEYRRVFGTVFRQQPQHLGHDVCPDPVVDAARHDAPVRQLLHVRVQHRGISDAHALERFGPGGGADVDPQVRDLGDLVYVLFLHEVDRLLADHAAHGSLRPRDYDALPDQHLGVPPADPGEVEVAVVIHVCHLEPDLVDVAGEHEARRALGVHGGGRVTVDIGFDVIGERLHLLTPHAGGGGLEAGWPRGVEQALQEVQRGFHHGWAGVERGIPSRLRTLSAAAPVASVA